MRITIDIQPEDIKEALEAHIHNHLGISATVSVDWLNGRYGITTSLGGGASLPVAEVAKHTFSEAITGETENKKRTRRSKEQIEADRLAAEQPVQEPVSAFNLDAYAEEIEQEPQPEPVRTTFEAKGNPFRTLPVEEEVVEESPIVSTGLMETIFAEEPEPVEPVKDIFAIEDNSIFAIK